MAETGRGRHQHECSEGGYIRAGQSLDAAVADGLCQLDKEIHSAVGGVARRTTKQPSQV